MPTRRIKRLVAAKTAPLLAVFVLLASATEVEGMPRMIGLSYPAPTNLSSANNIMRRLDRFECSLGSALKRSALSRPRRRDLLSRAAWLGVEVTRARDEIRRRSPKPVLRNELASALVDAGRINRVARNVGFAGVAGVEWGKFRAGLNSLATHYGLRTLGVRSYVNPPS